ncbi:hypothetical protein G7054_g14820 [Neopestalotiopsis clavispora]|nr:hypothetical protein G7054_g14820 [Neopestalotiopsis clavispora]
MLCSICTQTIEATTQKATLAYEKQKLPWHPDLASFENGVEIRCFICLEVKTDLEEKSISVRDLQGCTSKIPDIRSIADLCSTRSRASNSPYLGLHFTFHDPSLLPSHPPFRVPIRQTLVEVKLIGSDPAVDARITARPSESLEWDKSGQAQATQWYQNCLKNHETCNLKVGNRDFRPSRLLDLHDSSGIKLVETKTTEVKDPYVTLSHCWGGKVPLRLLEGNIHILKKEIPIDQLSKTFVHAIEVAQRLKFRYLWIDSLCIIQDSIPDWADESKSMAEVYSNASLNISATASLNGNGGLFTSSPTYCIADVPRARRGLVSTQFVTKATHENRFDDINLAPLSRRAWVLQERLLSPRVLHFARNQMFWECEGILSSQRCPDKLCTYWVSVLTKKHNNTRRFQCSNSSAYTYGTEGANETYKLWELCVEQYSAAAITKPSDKLIAISSLAKIVGQVLKDTYVAGLWRQNMPRCLMWAREQRAQSWENPAVERLDEKRAPTWSWAALDCAVTFEHCPGLDDVSRNSPLCTQLIKINGDAAEFHIEAGQFLGGELRLCGDLYQAKISMHDHVNISFDEGASLRRQFVSNGWLDGVIPDISFEEDTIIMLLPIYWNKIDRWLSGLVLRPVPKKPVGWYERFGIFKYRFKGHDLPTHNGESWRTTSSSIKLFLEGSENDLIIV